MRGVPPRATILEQNAGRARPDLVVMKVACAEAEAADVTKPISTRVHGLIDYAWAAAASGFASRLNAAASTARLLNGAASAATASSFVTKYEWGVVPVMPMKGHLAADFALCSVLVASPLFLPPSERRAAMIPVILGAMGIITGLLTDSRRRAQ
jgi:hypothetical protein